MLKKEMSLIIQPCFLIYLVVYSPPPFVLAWIQEYWGETSSNDLLMSKFMKSTALPLPTNSVISFTEAMKLVRCDLPLVNECWLFPVTFVSFLCPGICSKRTWSIIFPRNQREANQLVVLWIVLLAFLKDVCKVCLSTGIRGSAWSLQPFKNYREQLCKGISLLFPDPWCSLSGPKDLCESRAPKYSMTGSYLLLVVLPSWTLSITWEA